MLHYRNCFKIEKVKKIISIAVLVVPVFVLVFCSGSASVDNKKQTFLPSKNNITVLELFTSQGCSSCPPADRLLAAYANRDDIAALSFHVDYWNKLGWKDPFSNHAFSERQENYASSFEGAGVYTPQLIINGEKEMVGSDENKIEQTIKQLQKQQSSSQIIIDNIQTENNKISINYSVKGNLKNSLINIALVQKIVTTSIKAGENNGLTLTNYNVVRDFKTINSPSEKNSATIDILPGINKNEFSIILFLQEVPSNRITVAVKSSL